MKVVDVFPLYKFFNCIQITIYYVTLLWIDIDPNIKNNVKLISYVLLETDWDSNPAFFKALGSKDKVIKAADGLDDADVVRKLDEEILLYK